MAQNHEPQDIALQDFELASQLNTLLHIANAGGLATPANGQHVAPIANGQERVELLPARLSVDNLRGSVYDSTLYEFKGWPRSPAMLQQLSGRARFSLIDLLFASIAALWVVFAVLVYLADGTIVGEEDNILFEASRLVSLEMRRSLRQLTQ
jgi:hypothetical protein